MKSVFESLIQNIPATFYRCKCDKNWTMIFLNKAIHDLTYYPSSDFILNKARTYSSLVHPDDINYIYCSVRQAVKQNKPWNFEYRIITAEGIVKWVSETGIGIFSEANELEYLEGLITDISERKVAQEQLNHFKKQATLDVPTNLPNRYGLIEFLKHEVSRTSRHDYVSALMFLDLDRFKAVNDLLGHEAGDLVLNIIAVRLNKGQRNEDFVGRLGGDEFVIVLTELDKDPQVAAELAQTAAQRIISSIEETIQLSGHNLKVSCSIGITLLLGSEETTTEQLLKQADTAMYHAKNKGRGAASFFCEDMQKLLEKRLNLARELNEALEQEQFYLHYQPQATIDDQVFGVEALMRWNHPTRGLVGPDEFIPVAEEAGLINKLGCYVLRHALSEWSKFLADGFCEGGIKLAVNISPSHFLQTDFVDQIKHIVDAYELQNCQLVLEITEGVAVHDVADISDKMETLRQLGIGLSLDDFGTGYSSLSYIKRLPLDTLKIDRSFVLDIHTDPNDAAIVNAILAMTASLGIDVIAEGVETEAQRHFLEQRGCKFYQGYLFSRPAPLRELVEKGVFEQSVDTSRLRIVSPLSA